MIVIDTWVGDEVLCTARLTDYQSAEDDVGLAELVEWELVDADGVFTPDQLWAMTSAKDMARIQDELMEALSEEIEQARIDAYEDRLAFEEAYA